MEPLFNVVVTLAYDGTNYYGWQKTSSGKSIEEALEKALTTILQHPIVLQAASRTDRGVHAHHQVVNFFSSKSIFQEENGLLKFTYNLNNLLPKDIVALHIEIKDKEFHPTVHTTAKEYHYFIQNQYSLLPHLRFTHWHVPRTLDNEAMKEALTFFKGSHDFKAFCNMRKGLNYKDTIRVLYDIRIEERNNNVLTIIMKGDHFLYKMARNIVGTLIYVGLKKLSIDLIPEIFAQKKRIFAGITAPAHGLTLAHVYY